MERQVRKQKQKRWRESSQNKSSVHIDIFPFNGNERADQKNKRKAIKNGVQPRQNINIKSYFSLVTDVRKKEQ